MCSREAARAGALIHYASAILINSCGAAVQRQSDVLVESEAVCAVVFFAAFFFFFFSSSSSSSLSRAESCLLYANFLRDACSSSVVVRAGYSVCMGKFDARCFRFRHCLHLRMVLPASSARSRVLYWGDSRGGECRDDPRVADFYGASEVAFCMVYRVMAGKKTTLRLP